MSGKTMSKIKNAVEQGEPVEIDGITIDIKRTTNNAGEDVLDLHETAKELKQKFNFAVLKDRKNRAIDMFYYDPTSGIYRNDARDRVNIIVEQLFKNSAITNLKNEMYAHIRDQGFEYLDNWLARGSPHIVVNNGAISLEKLLEGEDPLESWSPDVHALNKLDVDYDPNAPDSLFVGHLQTVIPDESDRDRFHRFIGSFLETDAYGHQKIIISFGVEGSGKTVTLRTFSKFFGINNIAAKSFQQLAENRFAMADLAFAMANICEELPQSAIKQIEKLNSLTGGLVDGERKNRDPFTFYQNAKIAVACNDLPELNGDTTTIRAFMSRVIVIVFNRTIRDTPEDIKNFDDVLLQQKSGILNWVLDGYKKYIKGNRKIDSSRSTDETLEFYIANSDFMAYFVRGCTTKGTPDQHVIKENLWQAYLKAARRIGAATVTRQTFLQNFPQKFTLGQLTSERVKVNGKQQHVFKGMVLRPENEWFNNTNEENGDGKANTGLKDGNSSNGNEELEKYGVSNEKVSQNSENKGSVSDLPELPTHELVSANENAKKEKTDAVSDGTRGTERTDTPLQNDGTLGTDGTDLQGEHVNSDLQSENEEKSRNTSPNDKNSSPSDLVYRKVIFDSQIVNPDPEKYKIGTYFALTNEEAQKLAVFHFSVDITPEEYKANREGSA